MIFPPPINLFGSFHVLSSLVRCNLTSRAASHNKIAGGIDSTGSLPQLTRPNSTSPDPTRPDHTTPKNTPSFGGPLTQLLAGRDQWPLQARKISLSNRFIRHLRSAIASKEPSTSSSQSGSSPGCNKVQISTSVIEFLIFCTGSLFPFPTIRTYLAQ